MATPQRITCLEALMLVARRRLGLDRPGFGGKGDGGSSGAAEGLQGVPDGSEPLVGGPAPAAARRPGKRPPAARF
jgi:hypothetical protein